MTSLTSRKLNHRRAHETAQMRRFEDACLTAAHSVLTTATQQESAALDPTGVQWAC